MACVLLIEYAHFGNLTDLLKPRGKLARGFFIVEACIFDDMDA